MTLPRNLQFSYDPLIKVTMFSNEVYNIMMFTKPFYISNSVSRIIL